jgi:MFS family permease
MTALASAYTFLSPAASSMIAPATPDIAAEFHMTSTVEAVLTVSIFVLAYGTSEPFSSRPRLSH